MSMDKKNTQGIEDIQFADEIFIRRIKKALLNKLNLFVKNSLNSKNLDNDLGVFTLANIRQLLKMPVAGGYIINPLQIKKEQQQGITPEDYSRYKANQLVPFFVSNKEKESITGAKGDQKLYVIFFVPAVGVEISNKNIENHKKLFDSAKKKYEKINDIPYLKVKEAEFSKILDGFINGNFSIGKQVSSVQGSRRSNADNELPKQDNSANDNIQDSYNIINKYKQKNRNFIDMNNFHKNSLTSLLFEEKLTQDVRNIQGLSKATLAQVSKFIANKIDQQIPDIKSIDKKDLENPLGIIDFKTLNVLSKVQMQGLKVSPMQIKGEQIPGLNKFDFEKYKNLQIVPIFLTNKEMETIGGEKSEEEFAAIFYIPAIMTPIRKENIDLHCKMFGIKKPEKGKVLMHTGLNSLHVEMVTPEEVAIIQKSLTTGKQSDLARIENMQTKRIPTGSNQKPGEDQNKQTQKSKEKEEEEVKESLIYNNITLLHEHKLKDLIFEESILGKLKDKLKTFKGKNTDYVVFDENDINNMTNDESSESFDIGSAGIISFKKFIKLYKNKRGVNELSNLFKELEINKQGAGFLVKLEKFNKDNKKENNDNLNFIPDDFKLDPNKILKIFFNDKLEFISKKVQDSDQYSLVQGMLEYKIILNPIKGYLLLDNKYMTSKIKVDCSSVSENGQLYRINKKRPYISYLINNDNNKNFLVSRTKKFKENFSEIFKHINSELSRKDFSNESDNANSFEKKKYLNTQFIKMKKLFYDFTSEFNLKEFSELTDPKEDDSKIYTPGEEQTEDNNNNVGNLQIELNKDLDEKLKFFKPILRKDSNHKSKEIVGNILLIEFLEVAKKNKVTLDLDKFIEKFEKETVDNIVFNYNAVIERMKKDSADLKSLVEKFDDDSFDNHCIKSLTRTTSRAIAGLLGVNSRMLDHKVIGGGRLNESISGIFGIATLLTSLISFALGSPIIATTALGFGISGLVSKIYEIKKDRKKYAANPDLFAKDLIAESKEFVLSITKSVLISGYVEVLKDKEKELKEIGITLGYSKASTKTMIDDFSKRKENKDLKQNLNELGQTIYTEIIDNAYAFKNSSPIGKYINQSSIENMLINTIFGDVNNPRNKFSSLIRNLQQEGSKNKNKERLIYENGIKSLLYEEDTTTSETIEAEETSEKDNPKKSVSYEINKLRLQLSEIVTEEFNTANFKSDIMRAFEKELKKESEKKAKFFSRDKTNKKRSLILFYKVMKKVLGLSKSKTNAVLGMSSEDIKKLISESVYTDSVDKALNEGKLSLLLEKDKFLGAYRKGSNVYIEYQSDADGYPVRIMKATVDKSGNIVNDSSIEIVNKIPGGYTSMNNQADVEQLVSNMNTKYVTLSGEKSESAGYLGGGFDIDKSSIGSSAHFNSNMSTPAGSPPLEGPPYHPPFDGPHNPPFDPKIDDIETIDYTLDIVNLSLIAIKLGLLAYIRLDKRLLAGAEISKMLSAVNWAVLPGVAFAEIICQTLIKYRGALKENGVKIVGELSYPEEVGNEVETIASDELVDKIKQSMGKKSELLEKGEITDEDIKKSIESDLANICSTVIKRYDKERYAELKKNSDADLFASQRSGIKGLVNWIARRSDEDIEKRIKGSAKEANINKSLQKATAADVNKLCDVVIALAKSVKKTEESLEKRKLSDLLFENILLEDASHTITLDDLKSRLKASGVLIYGSEMDPDSADFKKSEHHLLETFAAFLKVNFGITVTGLEANAEILKTAAAEAVVEKEAEAGSPASAAVSQATKSSGVPLNLNQPFDMNQMAGMMNMCGGNPMFIFLMMMMNPQIMQNMMNIQKEGGSFSEAIDIVKQEASGELDEIDVQLNYALKQMRDGLPSISKESVKKLYRNIKNNEIKNSINKFAATTEGSKRCRSVVGDANKIDKMKDPQTFTVYIKERFNVTDKDVKAEQRSKLTESLKNVIMGIFDIQITSIDNSNDNSNDNKIKAAIAYKIVSSILGFEIKSNTDNNVLNLLAKSGDAFKFESKNNRLISNSLLSDHLHLKREYKKMLS